MTTSLDNRMQDTAAAAAPMAADRQGAQAPDAAGAFRRRFLGGLRGRILALTAGFLLVAELLIYPSAAANFREQWIAERVQAAQIAAKAIEAAPDGRVTEELSRDLLMEAQLIAVVAVSEDARELILGPSIEIDGPLEPIDLMAETRPMSVMRSLGLLVSPRGRFLQITAEPMMDGDQTLEVIVPEVALRNDLRVYSLEMLLFSLVVSAMAGALMYFALYRLVVRPIQGLTESVLDFAAAPEAGPVQVEAAGVAEIRLAQKAILDMQRDVSTSFRQRKRLADLGEAVAKINHDLRNSLAAAQLVSEGLSKSEDPRVQRAAPRLERAIERAIGLAEAMLRYGRAEPPAPKLVTARLAPVLEEAAAEAFAGLPELDHAIECPPDLTALVDADHVHRIIANLARNAARVLAERPEGLAGARVTIRAASAEGRVAIDVADNGPGVPKHLLPRLFQPFSGTTSRDGSGLGLAIARELARGMQGDLVLHASSGEGAVFRLTAPAGARDGSAGPA